MLIAYQAGHVLLEERPQSGIWGGLWSLPEFDAEASSAEICAPLGLQPLKTERLPAFLHVFTHYRLTITPQIAHVAEPNSPALLKSHAKSALHWIKIASLNSKGLPAPIRKLLLGLTTDKVLK
jgi:A/G-specific adenine glycosylase